MRYKARPKLYLKFRQPDLLTSSFYIANGSYHRDLSAFLPCSLAHS